ncbi:MAG: hypothetical protein R3E89_07350 [Thiolinea sp.]
MRSTPSVAVSDPGGLVKSQVMQTPDKAVSFTLNSSQACATVSSRILDRYAGNRGETGGHLADPGYFCRGGTVVAGRHGAMHVPENYYDDLVARFGLSDALRERLECYGILYDEDEQGVFYQLFTQLFAGRFCFEIVRAMVMAGLGRRTAQLRVTMQARELAGLMPV